MGFGSWFTKAIDVVTPWDRGGELERRRKREEEQRQKQYFSGTSAPSSLKVSNAQPNQQINVPKPQTQRPENLFQDLNKSLLIGQPKKNFVDVVKNQDTRPPQKLKPGTVVKPTLKVSNAQPNQRIKPQSGRPADQASKFPKQLVDQRLDAGKSWEQISRETGIDVSRIRAYSKGTRPDYGLSPQDQLKEKIENRSPSNATIFGRSVRSVGSNLTGGLLGVTKGAVELPSAVLSTPKLIRLGAAKITKNKEAEENIKNDKGVLSSLSEKYDRFVNPVTRRLTQAESATDKYAEEQAPWAPKSIKPTVKVLSNLIPVEAALVGLSKTGRGERFLRRGEIVSGSTGVAGSASRTSKNIPVGRSIEVVEKGSEATNVPVRDITQQGPVIREVGGDAVNVTKVPTGQQSAEQRAADKFKDQSFDRPDDRIEGVTPTDTGNTTDFFTKAQIERERVALDDALKNEEIDKAQHEAANKKLDEIKPVDESPKGKKIEVKTLDTIPVKDETIVPTGLPETPGMVRSIVKTEPSKTKSEAIAANIPPALPRETQEILDSPKQFNKRQVAAARNQRKLARQMAKTQEDTAEALSRIETASPAAQSGEGFVPTGEFGKSVNGGAIQKASRKAEMQQALEETSQMSPVDVLQTARKNQLETGSFNRRDIRNVAALFESKRIPRGTPEFNEAKAILKEDGTAWGQAGALRNYTIRRTANTSELMNRFESKIYRLADDPTKIDSRLFDEVEAAEDIYTKTRDDALAAYNRFTEEPTSANAKAYHAAQDAADKADKAAKITEYKVASKALKGNKDIQQVRELEKMANEADLYQMDAVDASMLSGTGTFVRNFTNATVGSAEEGLFGGLASRIARKITGREVGGGAGKGTIKGLKEGVGNVVDASKARAGDAGKNPLGHIKNWATTGNQLGDIVIDAQTTRNTLDHYKQLLKEQGYRGSELNDRASVMARQDPDNVGRIYATAARTAAGLGGGITRNNKIETIVKNIVSDAISFGNPNIASESTAKLITRMTIGFPTAIGRSTAEGVKRFTLGAPTFMKAVVTKDPAQRAILVKEGIKQAGTGSMVLPPLFYALGANGLITGSYPSDPDERARWEREGITENSIKIGGAYYQLPGYLGAWAVPGLFYASLGRNEGDFSAAASDTAKAVPAILPTDNISNWLDVINGRSDPSKFATQTAASAVRAATPGGALLNQLAKSFDPTKNDATSGSNIENFIDKVLGGIPGVNNMANIPDKVDDDGNVIQNPNAGQLLFGAASKAQSKGEESSAQITQQIDNSLQTINQYGLIDDPNMEGVLENKGLEAYNKLKAGKNLDESDIKALKEGLVKGVSSEGTDTAYLERGEYDTNLAVLQLKRDLMKEDKTTKPSSLKDIETAIKRGEVYKDAQVPYDLISEYKSVGVQDWRKMGNPESDEYDPEMYQQLWAIDQLMAKAGVSYRKGKLDKQKYYEKKAGSGSGRGKRGGSRASSLSSDFGTLKDGDFSPQVRTYASIDQKSGSIPIIRTVRPNIVHKIGNSG